MKHFFLFFLLTCSFIKLLAVTAYPYPVVFTQPNGAEITLIMQGDEFVRFAKTLDGYTLLYNSEGYFCYAQQNAQGDIEPSVFFAEDISKRSTGVNIFLTNIPKNLCFSREQLSVFQQNRKMVESDIKMERRNTTGVRKLLTILMEYPDRPFKKTQEDFHHLFNQVNYTMYGANGSVKDFFLESSYKKLEVETTVVGPFIAKNNHDYYGDFWYARELAREAVLAAHEAGVNFADFAYDGEVPSFYMIFQGNGQEAGAGEDCIWSHAWSIDPIYLDGVLVSSYACSPEHRGSSGNSITRIGVICHEFGHSLGAPDYYDTDYGTGGSYAGTGTWDLQASGSWNDSGRTPAPPNPRSKVYTYGWATVTELNSAQTVTIPSARLYDNAYYRINTQTPNEYYILENKILGSFDDYIPGKNMLIYHCAANLGGMNTTSPQKFYPVAANAPVDLPKSGTNCQGDYGTINSNLCAWPGGTGKKEFTDSTIPAMLSWNKQPTNKPISNITVHGDYTTFDILGGGPKNTHLVFLPNYFGCTITPEAESVSPVATGGSFTFSVSIAPSHSLSQIIVKSNGDILTPSQNLYTISNIQSDQIVTVEGLIVNSFSITASAGENGKINPVGTIIAPVENIQHFEFIPELGYSVNEIFIDGEPVDTAPFYDFINIEKSHTISVTFKKGDKYIIQTSEDMVEFETQPGVPSEPKTIIISSEDNLVSNIRATAPNKFEFSENGKNWYNAVTIGLYRLPFTMYIRYNPNNKDTENVEGKLTLCSTDVYKEVSLVGNLVLNVSENNKKDIILSPNPTTGELRVTSNKLYITNVEIYDVYGRKQKSRKAEEQNENNSLNLYSQKAHLVAKDGVVINISHLQTGIYFVKIFTDQGEIVEKVVKL